MNYFLVDFENVKIEKIIKLNNIKEQDALIIFYSENCKNIALDVMSDIAEKKLQFKGIKVKVGTKNALDFQLSSYLGYLIGIGENSDKYYIVSNDKGYDCLCDYWKKINISVERIFEQKSSEIKVAKKSGNKVLSENLATMEEIEKYLSKEDMPQKVLKIFNKYKTKQAICNGISKEIRDSKKTSAIYKKLKPLLKEKKKS